jgi:cysteine desulfuration protein SufE
MPDAPKIEQENQQQSIAEVQQDLIDEFEFLDDWMDRYRHIIDLGQRLEDFPEEWMTDEFKVRGCQSQVWLVPEHKDGRIIFHAASDAAIVSGLIAILLRIYSNRTPAEILETPPSFIEGLGLDEHLSPSRANGLHSMVQTMLKHAQAAA